MSASRTCVAFGVGAGAVAAVLAGLLAVCRYLVLAEAFSMGDPETAGG